MSLDFDRSPDGEPTAPAGQTSSVPAQQAPAMGPAQPIGPSFTPAPEPVDSEPVAGEHPAGEPGTAAGETIDDETVDDERTGAEPGTAADEPAADEPPVTDATAESAVTAAAAADAAADEPTASELTAYGSGAAPAWDARRDEVAEVPAGGPAGRPAGSTPTADLDGPLISDADELRTSWQRIQAAFVDDPRDAVADAAGLVEHTAQALVGALRQRQEQLRASWDRAGMPDGVEYADSGGAAPRAASPDGDRQAAADGQDTEQLRLLLQRYRALFNHLCRP